MKGLIIIGDEVNSRYGALPGSFHGVNLVNFQDKNTTLLCSLSQDPGVMGENLDERCIHWASNIFLGS